MELHRYSCCCLRRIWRLVNAVKYQEQAIELSTYEKDKAGERETLELYKNKKPYREGGQEVVAGGCRFSSSFTSIAQEQSMRRFRRAPQNSNCYKTRGYCLNALGRNGEADRDFKKADELGPEVENAIALLDNA